MTFLAALTMSGSIRAIRRKGWAPHVRIRWDPKAGWMAAADYQPAFEPLSGAYLHLLAPENLSATDWEVVADAPPPAEAA